MGWLPAFGVLEPATRHPLRRDAVMFGAHLVWGWTAAEAIRELRKDRAGHLRRRPGEGRAGALRVSTQLRAGKPSFNDFALGPIAQGE